MAKRETEALRKQNAEKALQRLLALDVAKHYCEDHELSFEKLREQRFELIYDAAIFAQPSDVIPNGLCNDLATQPIPTLIIKNCDGELYVKKTEHTYKFLDDTTLHGKRISIDEWRAKKNNLIGTWVQAPVDTGGFGCGDGFEFNKDGTGMMIESSHPHYPVIWELTLYNKLKVWALLNDAPGLFVDVDLNIIKDDKITDIIGKKHNFDRFDTDAIGWLYKIKKG